MLSELDFMKKEYFFVALQLNFKQRVYPRKHRIIV
jgi:hypothetical protein